jgi:hypothetical protein
VKCLEVLERHLAHLAPLLIERALHEGEEDAGIIEAVRHVVSATAKAGPEFLQIIEGSEAWQMFALIYPNEGLSILREAKLGGQTDGPPA